MNDNRMPNNNIKLKSLYDLRKIIYLVGMKVFVSLKIYLLYRKEQ